MNIPSAYPFAAVVGQEQVKKGLLIALVNPKAGGLLIGGPKGTAKSTLARSSAETGGKAYIEVPLNVTEDMLFGHIDMEYAVKQGKRRFMPGLMARANGRVLYIDGINLLPADVLTAILDARLSGVNRVEREGVSFAHEADYTVVGTMDPEEGTLPAQVLDRFGMYAQTENTAELEARVRVVERVLAFERDRRAFKALYAEKTRRLAEKIQAAQKIVSSAEVSEAMIQLAAQLTAKAFCAGHRAELYLLEAAKALAALDGRSYVLPGDMEEAAGFVLVHRMRQTPSRPEPETERQEPDESDAPPEEPEGEEPGEERETDGPPDSGSSAGAPEDGGEQEKESDASFPPERREEEGPAQQEQIAAVDESFHFPRLALELGKDRAIRRGSGKRGVTRTDLKQGRYVRAALMKGKAADLAFDATIRAAAPFQRLRAGNGCAICIEQGDLRCKVREKRIGNTFLFVVDASGSMGARERMKAVKGAVFCMLQEAYQKRDQVGMIAFRRDAAEVLLPITRSVDLAQKCLRQMPTGGKTPLAEGLEAALSTLEGMRKRDKEQEPVLILLTDGRANAGENAVDAALKVAKRLRTAAVTAVVIDTETDFIQLGIARALAREMGATYRGLKQLSKEQLLRIARNAASDPVFEEGKTDEII